MKGDGACGPEVAIVQFKEALVSLMLMCLSLLVRAVHNIKKCACPPYCLVRCVHFSHMHASLGAPYVVVRRWSMLLSVLRAKSARGKNSKTLVFIYLWFLFSPDSLDPRSAWGQEVFMESRCVVDQPNGY
jgi:hypothetical protein